MTDNEIIRGLEFCANNGNCDKCEFAKHDTCFVSREKEISALISRQKAEIEKKAVEIDILIRKKETLKDEVSELRAEVERLTNVYKQCAWERDVFAEETREELTKHITICEAEKTEIKSEARKEFAERLCDLASKVTLGGKYEYRIVTVDGIKYLLAKMKSETDTNVGSKTEKGGEPDAR